MDQYKSKETWVSFHSNTVKDDLLKIYQFYIGGFALLLLLCIYYKIVQSETE